MRTRSGSKFQANSPSEEKLKASGSVAADEPSGLGPTPATEDADELASLAISNMRKYLQQRRSTCVEGTDTDRSTPAELQPDMLMLGVPDRSAAKCDSLASSLQPGLDVEKALYFNFAGASDQGPVKKFSSCKDDQQQALLSRSVITPDFERKECAPPIRYSRLAARKMKKLEREKTTGKNWFDMPAIEVTPELKNDLRVLKMRSALDPAQHYKANDSKALPKYFQVGRVISGHADHYTAIPKRQRKRTIVEELLQDDKFKKYQKKKFLELQQKFKSGTRRHKSIRHKKFWNKKS